MDEHCGDLCCCEDAFDLTVMEDFDEIDDLIVDDGSLLVEQEEEEDEEEEVRDMDEDDFIFDWCDEYDDDVSRIFERVAIAPQLCSYCEERNRCGGLWCTAAIDDLVRF